MKQYIIDEDQDPKSKSEEEIDENLDLDFEEFAFTNFNPKSRKILEDLEKDDPDFNKKIETILSKLSDSVDLTEVQSEILLLISEKLNSIKEKDKSLATELDEKKSQKILKHILDLSQYLINQKSQIARTETKGLQKPQDKYQYLSKDSIKNLKSIMRRFVVYELYKVINPHQIAGETRKETFIHNVILRGLEVAKHFEGGSEAEIRHYGINFVKDLQNKGKSFKKNNNIFR